jgi:hypothetical protein
MTSPPDLFRQNEVATLSRVRQGLEARAPGTFGQWSRLSAPFVQAVNDRKKSGVDG